MKNLAEAQAKERVPVNEKHEIYSEGYSNLFQIEETLNGKFKEWNAQKEVDNKVRTMDYISFCSLCLFSIVFVKLINRKKSKR